MMSTEQKDDDFAVLEDPVRIQMRKLIPRLHEDGALSHAVPYMVADSAGAIKNGEALVNGPLEHDEEKLLTCYSHMLRGHFTSFVQAPDQETKPNEAIK